MESSHAVDVSEYEEGSCTQNSLNNLEGVTKPKTMKKYAEEENRSATINVEALRGALSTARSDLLALKKQQDALLKSLKVQTEMLTRIPEITHIHEVMQKVPRYLNKIRTIKKEMKAIDRDVRWTKRTTRDVRRTLKHKRATMMLEREKKEQERQRRQRMKKERAVRKTKPAEGNSSTARTKCETVDGKERRTRVPEKDGADRGGKVGADDSSRIRNPSVENAPHVEAAKGGSDCGVIGEYPRVGTKKTTTEATPVARQRGDANKIKVVRKAKKKKRKKAAAIIED